MFGPYVGADGAYAIIFSTRSAALADAKPADDLVLEIEAGTDLMFQSNLDLFAQVKKAWLMSHATGSFDGLAFNGTANYAHQGLCDGCGAAFLSGANQAA